MRMKLSCLISILSITWGLTHAQFPWMSNDDYIVARNEQSCPDVEECYCTLSGPYYQAECHDPELTQIPINLPYDITALIMTGTQLDILTVKQTANYTMLRLLDLSQNQLQSVEQGSLDHLPDLEIFIIKENFIDNLPANLLSYNTLLTHFDASGNELLSIPSVAGLSKLVEIILDENKIATLPAQGFLSCNQLQTIRIAKNALVTIQSGAFDGAGNVTVLDMSYNQINSIDAEALGGLTNISTINLQGNELHDNLDTIFSGLNKLLNLDLSYNKIDDIGSSAFNELLSLKYLYLANNLLITIPSLGALTKLSVLDLSENKIITIQSAAFATIVNLKELFLRGMDSMTTIQIGAFQNLVSLERLDLSENINLGEIHPNQLPGSDVPVLMHLYLNGNGLTYIAEELLDDKSNLLLANLYDNPFNCSCDLKWMARAIADEKPWALAWATGNSPTCRTPVHLLGWEIASMLEDDLTCEQLVMTSLTPLQQVTHLMSRANFTVHLHKGLPASKWTTPDGVTIEPQPYTGKPLDPHRYATWLLLDDNVIQSTMFLEEAQVSDQGTYTVLAQNIAGNKSITFNLEVLPYVYTTTSVWLDITEPSIGGATKVNYQAIGVFLVTVSSIVELL